MNAQEHGYSALPSSRNSWSRHRETWADRHHEAGVLSSDSEGGTARVQLSLVHLRAL